jgi:hypothetical protein
MTVPPGSRKWRDEQRHLQPRPEEATRLARAAFPERSQRIDEALRLIRDGRVFQRSDGEWEVDSVSHEGLRHSVNGSCDCPDFTYRSNEGPCKHQIAVLLSLNILNLKKLQTATPQTPAPAPAPQASPEAPFSVTLKGAVGGISALLTVRAATADELRARLTQITGLLDAPAPPTVPFARAGASRTSPPSTETVPVCQWHGAMRESAKAKGTYFCPAKMGDNSYCKERFPKE